ncbi:MAG: DUF3810 family protein [Eubacterium sp.]|nr:DUF3810 family protein [Eubacterium sp.]
MEKKSRYKKTMIILLGILLVFLIPGFSPSTCDLYADRVYPGLCDVITRVTSLIPVAIGEIIMILGIFTSITAVILSILLIFLRKNKGFFRFAVGYLKVCSVIILCTVIIYIPTWYIPFRGTVLGMGSPNIRKDFTDEELEELLYYIIDNGNAAAEEIEISDDGKVIFRSSNEIESMAADAMARLGDEYTRLKGYYPKIKVAVCSDILNRMYIGGYNYPFTMEPTRNKYINPLYLAILDAHEYAHHKGYYKENEANFLSQLALSRSDDPYLRLAAYMNMYSYVYSDYMSAHKEQYGDEEGPGFSERVKKINEAAIEEERILYESDEHLIDSLPVLDRFIKETADAGWDVQGEILQENSYDGVVLLLLQHYYGELDR